MKNSSAIRDFIDHCRSVTSVEERRNGDCTVNVKVQYQYANKTIEESTKATFIINGYDQGRVSLEENGVLSDDLFHLTFDPKYQKYNFDKKEHKFSIEASSPKMHGPYKVTLIPE